MLYNFGETFRINRVIKYFVLADLALFSGWGMVSPIFSIFVIEDILGATLATVGGAAAAYWLIKSAVQLPIATRLDKIDSDKAPLYVLIAGLILTGVSAILFVFINSVWQLYAVQILHAVGMGSYVVSWHSIYSRHLDKNKVAFEWALNSSSLGFAAGTAGFIGGHVANNFGFDIVFWGAGILSFLSAFIIFVVPDLVLPPPTKVPPNIPKNHTPKSVTH